ncbi:Eukaryotic translation initiation factor 3 subunit F [Smittium mucronatum]|uniref:Eukaryotic translation initiation factor 3 subunit F n=1 Tax=Smittium mucronatum TaxID=133383 RepID=A0A1R0H4H2_9FUNG|nr:Eukaryotic translation initiation factor 3 subunit F [Smittium mucronatum]
MTQSIDALKVGDMLLMRGPIVKYKYVSNTFSHIGLLAGGTGIAPMLQIIRKVLGNPADNTKLSLVFGNVSTRDILLKQELDDLVRSHPSQFTVSYIVDQLYPDLYGDDSGWTGYTGLMTKELLQKLLPDPTLVPNCMAFVSGPPAMMDAVCSKKRSKFDQGPGPSISTKKGSGESEKTQQVFLSPSVPFSIIDHYIRRNDKQDRVIGTLLGVRRDGGRVVEIRSCFPVPHFETDSHVEVDMEYHRFFYAALKKANPTEEIVGWYATGGEPGKHATLIQEFYALEAQPHEAVHMIMDTGLETNSLNIQMLSGLYYGSSSEGCKFVNLPYEFVYPEAERKVLDLVSRSCQDADAAVPVSTDMDQLEAALVALIQMIERVSQYVDSVLNGSGQPNVVVGKYLLDMLASVPKIDPARFESLFQSHLQNILMVIYLSNLTRTQITLANRLHHLV